MVREKLLAASVLLAVNLIFANASATVFSETGDAPQSLAGSPQDVGTISNGDSITGTIGGLVDDDGDLYKFSLAVSALVDISVTATGSLSPEIYLFDAGGGGIAFGNTSTSNPVISMFLAAGMYNLGIGDAPLQAIDIDGTIWEGGAPPAGFSTLNELFVPLFIDPGDYEISFAVSVDAPTTLVLFGLGLAGLGFARRRNAAT